MERFRPNEAIVEGFQRLARSARAKVKHFLLKKAGMTSHDIRIMATGNSAVLTSRSDDPFDEYRYYKLFCRAVGNTSVRILNCSRTSPSILEIHFFLELPTDSPLALFRTEKEGDQSREVESREFADRKDLVEVTGEDRIRSFSIPVLENGRGLQIEDFVFSARVDYKVDPETKTRLGNDPDFRPPAELLADCKRAFEQLEKGCAAWIGLVLDSEELLPYRWDHDEQRFEPGFYSDGVVVPLK